MAKPFDNVKVTIATTGQGTVTFGPKTSNAFETPAEAGAVDNDPVGYILRDGNDWEIGDGVVGGGVTTMTRTVRKSSIGGVVGTTKLTLSGTATLGLIVGAADLALVGVVRKRVFTALNGTCTISNASPAVVTMAGHGRAIGDAVSFATTGGLPTGLTAGTVYYVISAGFGAGAFRVSATPGGSAINTSSAGSGTHTLRSEYVPDANILYGEAFGLGAGGGGGSCLNQLVAGYHGSGGGGGAGQPARKTFSKSDVGGNATVSIGAGGTGGTANSNNATNGGNTTFGSLLTAVGGQGGAAGISGGGSAGGTGGSGGTGDLLGTGQPGGNGQGCTFDGLQILSGAGGSTELGGGGAATSASTQANGSNGSGYGSGGSGGVSHNASATCTGGNGASGCLCIWEFCTR